MIWAPHHLQVRTVVGGGCLLAESFLFGPNLHALEGEGLDVVLPELE